MLRLIRFACAGAILVMPTAALAAGHMSSAEDKVLHDYVLTMPKVKAYEAATENLGAVMNKDPAVKAEEEKASNEPDKTFADVKAKFTHHPRFYAFFARHGLSVDDAVLIPLTLMSACSVVQYPQIAASTADSVSPAQIAFCKQNIATLKAMKFFNGGGME